MHTEKISSVVSLILCIYLQILANLMNIRLLPPHSVEFDNFKRLEEHQEFEIPENVNQTPVLRVVDLDFTDVRPLPPNWVQFDNFKRLEEHQEFEIPEVLKERPGKLIHFSLGSMGGADVELMKRLIGILSKSKHRFIVSKGPLHDKYELADNMWGQQSVNQIQVLSVVDLVITYGGNNTVTETFYFGKPMIVMPLFCDQYEH